MSKLMRLGVPGRMVEIPCPDSGMGFDNELDTDVTQLISGGRSVWSAPTSFESRNMSWKGGFHNLQPLIDLYKGKYGRGPYYMLDPRIKSDENVLPARWASSYQLAYLANGWSRPRIEKQNNTPEGLQSVFHHPTNAFGHQRTGEVNLFVPRGVGQQHLTVWGEAIGEAYINVYMYQDGVAYQGPKITPTLTGATALVFDDYHSFAWEGFRISLWLEPGSTLKLQHMESSNTPLSFDYRSGLGMGAWKFTGNLGGTLNSTAIDRIGLSVDITEVQEDPNY